jgi:hypothetical protein
VGTLPSALTNSFPDISIVKKCTPALSRGAARESIRKLTRTQLLRTLQTLFPSLFLYSIDEASGIGYPENYWRPNYDVMGGYIPDVSADPTENFDALHLDSQVAAWARIANRFGSMVAASPDELGRYGGSCTSQTPITSTCWTGFVRKLGRSAYRRPLTDAEVADVVSWIQETDTATAIQNVVARLLRSPNTIFVLEFGTPDPSGRVRLTDHEVATRLAFDLTDAPPDGALAAAADAGQLHTLDQVHAQAERLMTGDLAKARFRKFVYDWMRMNLFGNVNGVAAMVFGLQSEGEYTGRWAMGEMYQFIDYVAFTKGGAFQDLMTSPIAFPLVTETSIAYGTGTTKLGTPLTTPDHPGLLLRAAMLQSSAISPSPINRGVDVLRRVECTNLPSPDFSIIATRLTALATMDPMKLANWQITQQVTASADCQACHAKINPIGFLFEPYNVIGMRRTEDEYYGGPAGYAPRIAAHFPLPGPQTVTTLDPGLPTSYPDAVALIGQLAQSENARACLALRLFRDIQARPESLNDACALADTVGVLDADQPLTEVLVRSVANEDIFWRTGQ